MGLYAEVKHAFGVRRAQFPITAWPQLAEVWLRTIKVLSEWVLAASVKAS
jgi:hypothetical protein